MELLETLADEARNLARGDFATTYPGPFLVRRIMPNEGHLPVERKALMEDASTPRRRSDTGLRTVELPVSRGPAGVHPAPTPAMGVSAVQVSPEPQRPPVWRRYTAYEVKKTGRNVFARGITLGRAPNNDVWLSMPEVSHFHAWLVAENGAWRVFDAQSSNGTFVNNNQAKPGADQGLLMRPQDELRLGDIAFAFFDGESLHRWLTAQRSR